jgi:hypothetical protein
MKNNFFQRFNILHFIWLGVVPLGWWLLHGIVGQSHFTFFGAAETEGQVLNYEFDVVIKRVQVKVGQQVQRGDTLALLMRADNALLNKQGLEKKQEIKQFEVEKQSKINEIRRELKVLDAKKDGLIDDLEAQIKILQMENKVQADLKKILSQNTEGGGESNIKNEKVNVLRNAIKKVEQEIREQKGLLQAQMQGNDAIFDTKIAQTQEEKGLIENDGKEGAILATMDGFIENIFVGTNEIAPQYKPLFKINPKKPNRVKGFIYENSDWAFNLGDSVVLTSSPRPMVVSKGVIIGCSPQLVELPTRLRRYEEVKTWGREIYIQLPLGNDFYIGEKIMIKPIKETVKAKAL